MNTPPRIAFNGLVPEKRPSNTTIITLFLIGITAFGLAYYFKQKNDVRLYNDNSIK